MTNLHLGFALRPAVQLAVGVYAAADVDANYLQQWRRRRHVSLLSIDIQTSIVPSSARSGFRTVGGRQGSE
jgi:hypothetical protein